MTEDDITRAKNLANNSDALLTEMVEDELSAIAAQIKLVRSFVSDGDWNGVFVALAWAGDHVSKAQLDIAAAKIRKNSKR